LSHRTDDVQKSVIQVFLPPRERAGVRGNRAISSPEIYFEYRF